MVGSIFELRGMDPSVNVLYKTFRPYQRFEFILRKQKFSKSREIKEEIYRNQTGKETKKRNFTQNSRTTFQ
jgi:hypothetical protein